MRFQRIGKKGQAYFRIVVTEHTKKPQGEFLELLGSYDPHKKDLKVKKERIEYWMSKGVQLSPTVNNLLINKKIISAEKKQSWKPKVKKEKDKTVTAAPVPESESSAPETEAPAPIAQ
jgi:small subunit ribosomal protein S16